MSGLLEILKEVPLSSVMKERVALANAKFEAANDENAKLRKRVTELEEEVAELRGRLPAQLSGALGNDTARVLVRLFEAVDHSERGVANIARRLNMKENVVEYHLDQLDSRGLAVVGSVDPHDEYWLLTSEGRAHVVENGLS